MNEFIEQKDIIKEIFRDVIYEVIREERINFYQTLFPNVSLKENQEIENLYDKPENYKKDEFKDMSLWIMQ